MKSTKLIMKSNLICASYSHWTYTINYRDGASEPSKMHKFRTCAYHKAHSTNPVVTWCLNGFNHRHLQQKRRKIMMKYKNASYLHWTHTNDSRDGASDPSRMHKFC